MKRKLSAVEARQKLGEVLEGVYYRGDEVIIERAGKTMAVVVPASLYESMQKQRQDLYELLEENWEKNKDVPMDEIERDIESVFDDMRTTQTAPREQ